MIDKLRRRIIDVAYRDGMGHIPSALSILDIVWTLYDKVMTKDDQFILSKGHGCMALYAVLEEKGLLDWSKPLQGHPRRGGAILASTGSLGHGLPMALGLAMAKKIKGESGRVFCLIGDGECNEGTTWESALLAAHQRLDNLNVIVDQNHSSDRALSMGDIAKKFASFGWNSSTTHESDSTFLTPFGYELFLSRGSRFPEPDLPIVTVFNTLKGNGVLMMQDPSWHNKKLTEQDYINLISSRA